MLLGCAFLFIILLLPSFSIKVVAQQSSGERCIVLPVRAKYHFDSIAIIPTSILVYRDQALLSNELLNFDTESKTLYVNILKASDSLQICYSVLPSELTRTYFLINKPSMLSSRQVYNYFIDNKPKHDVQSTYLQLNRSGSVSRGITMSNNSNVSLTGGLNLQMSGKIAPNLWLAASLSDANIPVQPEGNTSQLNEFDKIFIQIYNNRISSTLGDYQLSLSENRFLRVNKKQQGFLFEIKPQNNNSEFSYSGLTSGSISKGKYHRQLIVPIEGNHGPYKLQGADNERFIIIIAASERVYIDGVLLERGENGDYTIDYNSGEITFTPKSKISRHSRISVEFEYSNRMYARFVTAHVSRWKSDKSTFAISIMSENDAKNQTYDIELKDEWRKMLSEIGDNVSLAYVENVRTEQFNPDVIQYALQDTTHQGVSYTIYRYSTNRDSAIYSVGFSYVGKGRGNYVSASRTINGKVYKWVAPVNGVKQGDYEHITLLTTPKSKHNIATKVEHKMGAKTTFYSDITYSYSDINTFSGKDKFDNNGIALISGVKVGSDSSRYSGLFEYQYIHKHFETFEKYRTTEFDRDWNLTNSVSKHNEQLANLKARWHKNDTATVEYRAEALLRGDNYKGLRNNLLSMFFYRNIRINTSFSLSNTSIDTINGRFLKSDIKAGYAFKNIFSGIQFISEENLLTLSNLSLAPSSFNFYNLSVFSETEGTKRYSGKLSLGIRDDQKGYDGNLSKVSRSNYIQSEGRLTISPTHSWEYLINFKSTDIANQNLWVDLKPENTLSSRITNRISIAQRSITLSNFYEIGSGLEAKKEYAYLKTLPGEGTHIWRDINNNGIKEISEFELAAIPAEADYIRYFIPTNDYINAYYGRFRANININLGKLQFADNMLLRGVSRFSNQTSFQVNHKTQNNNFFSYGNPFFVLSGDTVVLSEQLSLRSVFSYGRTHQRWGIDYTFGQNKNKQLLANGFETRVANNQAINIRINILLVATLFNEISLSKSGFQSQAFAFKNYSIDGISNSLRLELTPNIANRFDIQYNIADRSNTLSHNSVNSHSVSTSFQYSKAQTGNLNISLRYVYNIFSGNANDHSNYELLEGFQPGKNLVWQIGSIISISKHFQITIQYHGRTAPSINTIHTGSVMAKVYF